MSENVLSSAKYDFGDDKVAFAEFDSDDTKSVNATPDEEEVKLQYTKMLNKIDLTLQMLVTKDLEPDEKSAPLLMELQAEKDVFLKPDRRKMQHFIASGTIKLQQKKVQ